MFSQASPAKFCVSIVFNFSWDGCNTPEKRKNETKNKGYAKAGGGGGGGGGGVAKNIVRWTEYL